MSDRQFPWSLLVFALFLLVGCKTEKKTEKTETPATPATEVKETAVSLNGAGATFPYPLYSKWMAEYNRQHPNVRINYQSIGSGGGIRQIVAGTVDFGATDAPMKDEEAKGAPGKLDHVPMTMGAVVVSY